MIKTVPTSKTVTYGTLGSLRLLLAGISAIESLSTRVLLSEDGRLFEEWRTDEHKVAGSKQTHLGQNRGFIKAEMIVYDRIR